MASGWLVRTLTTLAVVLAVGAATPGRACACSCAPAAEREQYATADAVFVGRVIERKDPRRLLRRDDGPVTITYEVSIVHKGTVAARQQVHTDGSSASCGISAEKGREYLVFAGRSDRGLGAYLCGGTRPADKPLNVPTAASDRPTAPRSNASGTPGADPADSTRPSFAVGLGIASGVAVPAIVIGFLLRRRRKQIN